MAGLLSLVLKNVTIGRKRAGVRAARLPGVAAFCLLAGGLACGLGGCRKAAPPAPEQGPMTVMVEPVALHAVPSTESFVATVKSRRSATISPQVDGNITKILVTSGQSVKAGQVLMTINPLKQQATVEQQVGSQAQANASFQFNKGELDRQKQLFAAGIISKQAYDTAVQNFESSQAAYNASAAGTATQKEQLAYYQIRAPFAGVVGDIPVHVGDYVTPASVPATVLTTIDDPSGLEAYIYIPTDRSSLVKSGLPVAILDSGGQVLTQSSVSFISPEVDNGIQGILAKAEIPASSHLRTQQVVTARVTWNESPKPTVPVLAVQQIGGQSFVFVAKNEGRGAERRKLHGASGAGHAGRSHRQQLPHCGRAYGRPEGDRFGSAVYRGGRAGEADDRAAGTSRTARTAANARSTRGVASAPWPAGQPKRDKSKRNEEELG